MFDILVNNPLDGVTNEPRCVVRLTTSYWYNDRGLHMKRSLTYLHRKSKGFNWVKEDATNIGAEDVVANIVNLDKCEDGIYIIGMANAYRDWESGYIDTYDYQLIPYTETKNGE